MAVRIDMLSFFTVNFDCRRENMSSFSASYIIHGKNSRSRLFLKSHLVQEKSFMAKQH